MSPTVTVLMTVYNGMPYLPEAVESLLGQTYADFGLLAIDDASTDGSAACMESYRDPRVHRVRNDRNLGQAASLNKGLKLLQSEFVARLDQDDVCEPERLALQLAYLKAHPQMAACGSWITWMDARGRKIGIAGFSVEDDGAFLGLLLGQTTPLAHPTVLMRSQAIKTLGGYDSSFAPCEDYELWCRLALRRQTVGVVPRPLLRLRIHDRQQSMTKLAIQKEQAHRAHGRLVAAFCDEADTLRVGELLRMEPIFWDQCVTHRRVHAVCQTLERMLARIRLEHRLSQRENRSLGERISGWLVRTAFLGILRRKTQSLSVYLLACRLGRCKSLAFTFLYPLCFLLSPLFAVAALREAVSRTAWWLNRQRHVARLIWNALKV